VIASPVIEAYSQQHVLRRNAPLTAEFS